MLRWFALPVLLALLSGALMAEERPDFRITGQYNKSALSILVSPKDITPDKLRVLINAFRSARKSGGLSSLIPPTTQGGSLGPYAVVDVYVFSDSNWATSERLSQFIKSSAKSSPKKAFLRRFIAEVKAYYHYSALNDEEEGSLGYSEGSTMQSPHYKRLF